MSQKKERTWINKCKLTEKRFDNGSYLINAAFNVEELQQHANKDGWVNLVISPRREVSEKGATHSVYLSEWEPKEGDSPKKHQSTYKKENVAPEPGFDDDIPF